MKRKLLILFLTCVVGWLSPLNAQETTFSYDFDSGTTGWVVFNDGTTVLSGGSYTNFITTSQMTFPSYATSYKQYYQGNNSTDGIVSMTYDLLNDSRYKPNNYIVTTDKYQISQSSKLSWDVKAPIGTVGEYYEVVVSTDNKNFTSVFSETLTNISAMTNKEVGLSEYADQSVYIGFRHYGNTYTQQGAHIVIDDVVLSAEPTELTVTATASDTDVYIGETTTLTATATGGTGEYTYSWSPATGLSATNVANPTFTPTATGIYTFTCTVTDGETTVPGSVTVNVTERPVNPYAGKQYRVQVYSGNNTGKYLNASTYSLSGSITSYVNTVDYAESNTQIFTIEQYAEDTYYLKTLDGYYIKCNAGYNSWNVDCYSTSAKTPLLFEYVNENFYIRDTEKSSTSNYFKVNTDGKVYCDAAQTASETVTWVLEEYVAPPLEITSAYASASEVYTGTEVTLTVSATGGSGNYTYSWTCTPAPAATDFYNTTQAEATFKPTSTGTYKITCTVNDGTSSVTSEEIEVVVLDSSTKCTIVFEMTDSYGDNWAGSYLKVEYDDNVVNVEYTDPDTEVYGEPATIEETLDVPTGSQITVSFVSGGGYYDSECSYVIKYEDGTIIYLPQSAVDSKITFEACGAIPLMLTLSADNDAKGCEGSDIQLTATATGGTENYNYNWTSKTEGALEMLSATNIANPVFTPLSIDAVSSTVTYTCTVNDRVTKSSDEITLTVYDTPELNISENVIVDSGENLIIPCDSKNNTFSINVEPYVQGTTYEYPNETDNDYSVWNVIIPVTEDGQFTVTASNNYYSGCAVSKTINVSVVNCGSTPTTITIGDDVAVDEDGDGWNDNYIECGSSYNNRFPIRSGAEYSVSQQIYTAEELTEKGLGVNDEITSIAFKVSALNDADARTLDVYLINTDKEGFDSENDYVPISAESNYTGDVTFKYDGWTTINLTTPLKYEGGNVLVCLNDKTNRGTSANCFCLYTTRGEERSIGKSNFAAEFTAPDFTTTSSYVENNENQTYNDLSYNSQIQFTYTPWAGSSNIEDASIIVDNEEICYYEDDLGNAINYFNFEAGKINCASYLWDFGDDSEGVGQKVTHNYLNHGKYTVTLTVTQGEDTKVVTKDVVVLQKPTAEFTLNHSCYFVGQEMQFIPVETIENSTFELKVWEADGAVEYDWNYSEYNHELKNDGTATVRYTHKNGDDCYGTKDMTVEVYPTPIFSSTNTCNGNATEFSVVLEGISDYEWDFSGTEGFVWDFGDGKGTSNGETVTYKYNDPGTYDVKLTVYKGDNSYTYSHQVAINATPTADFAVEGEYALTDITFTATNAGDGATYAWNFGDETEGTGVSCKHQYALPDEYTVTLTVTQNDCTSTVEQTITIEEKVSGAAIYPATEPAYVDLGYRPANGWMRPYTVNITPDGNTSLTITSLTVEDDNVDYDLIELSHKELPVTLLPGEKFPVEVSTKILEEGDFIDVNFYIFVNGEVPTNQTEGYTGLCSLYPAAEGDIFELPIEIDASLEDTYYPSDLYPNYLLPGVDTENDYYDAVFKFTFEEATSLTATVNGTNPVAYVYPADFGDEPGPGLTNYVGYVNPDAPVQLEFERFEFDFTYDYIDYGEYSGYVQETELWTSGPKDGEENAWFITGNDGDINGGEDNMYVTSRLRTEDNYFITKDKYYISETAKFSMDVWASNAVTTHSYYVFVSEDGTNFTSVYEGTVSTIDKTNIDISLSEYAGKEYYVGVVHVGTESLPSSATRIRLDNIKLYEPETRALRADAEPTLNIMLEAGTYYLVAAAANIDFTVTIGSETLLEPGQAAGPSPYNKEPNVSTTLEQLTWTFGENTGEYQVLFGTTNPPTDVLVNWNNNIENASCALSSITLMTNTVYYWQVNAKNIKGETEGDIWRFATPFDAPQNLALTSTEINVDDETSPTLTWDAVAPTTITGYNIWAGTKLLTEDPITEINYDIDIDDLGFSAEPYKIYVEAIYMVDGFRIASKSSSVELKVNAEASVKGFVYDATTGEPIVGATVTYATTELTTDANGYTGKVPAGNYRAVARMAGYNKSEVTVELVPSEETYTYDFRLEPTMTLATGVIATENADKTAVDVKWQFNLEGDPMFEDFENGFTYEWTTSADYSWTVVEITGGPEETVNAGVFGQYCAKSGNYNVPSSTSWIELSTFIPFDGKISFYYRISSEPYSGSDIGNFYIDGYQQYIKEYDGDPYNECFGSTLWQDGYREFDVTAGSHIFKWEYKKDDNELVGNLEDAFYIDNISFYENTNVYNVYRRDILTAEDPTNLAENLTEKELADTEWANEDFADGIYQWGVSVKYNEPAGDLLNEDFEVITDNTRIELGKFGGPKGEYTYMPDADDIVTSIESEEEYYEDGYSGYNYTITTYYGYDRDENEEPLNNGWTQSEGSNWVTGIYSNNGFLTGIVAKDYNDESAPVTSIFGLNNQGSDGHYYLVTPKVNALRQSYLEFDYIVPQFNEELSQDFNRFRVLYGETPEGPWTALTEYNKEPVNDEWAHYKIELPLIENCYIAFENYDHESYGLGIGLDNVRIYREAVIGESNIAWSNLIGKGNELVNDGDWDDENNWSRTHVPTTEEVAVIKAAGTVNVADAVAKAVLVDNGTLTIGENGVLTASTVIDSVAADITINAGGQLVHSNEGVMATFVKGIQAYTDANNNDGWYTISSPLAADINASDVDYLLHGEFDLYRYDEPTHYWENYEDAEDAEGPDNTDWDNNSAVIEKGRGYLYANKADKQLSFAGELNVADVTTTLSAQASSLTGFNLLGNPFAHNIYKGVAFNGSIADAHYTLNYHGEWQVVTSDNPIKSGAGFLVQATEGANLTISKTNAQTRAAANSMLAVTVVNNVFEDVAYVSFNDGIGLEKIGHMNEYAPMVYIPGDFNNYAYATVEEDVTEVPVNFEAMTMGEYTIAVKAKNCEYETMVLVDNLTGKETNLLKDSYTFMATTTDDPDRFVIKLAKDAEVEDSFIYINNGELIFDNLSNDAIINVFDVLGRNVATFNNCGDTTFRVSTDLFADGVYMVRVIEGNNVKVQKMVIE